MRYIEKGKEVSVVLLEAEDMDAILRLMPKFWQHLMTCGVPIGSLYLIRDGINIKVVTKDVLDKDYDRL